MSTRRLVLVASLVTLTLGFGVASAQTPRFELEAGYQWLDLSGNEDMYRSQVNQDDGFILDHFSLSSIDPSGNATAVDRLRIDAAGFGGSPDGHFRLEAGLADTYRLHLNYRRANVYSALPGFANPFAGEGVVPGQHTLDRTRDSLDFEVEVLPGHTISPVVGYRWYRYEGPARTTYHVGGDEFQLSSNLDQTEDEFYAGVAFHAGTFNGMVTQGWRSFDATEDLALLPGAGEGNNTFTLLGVDPTMDSYQRHSHVKSDTTPVTTAYVTGLISDGVRVKGSFIRSDFDVDTTDQENLSGNLVSYTINRFFAGLDETAGSKSKNSMWRGDLHLEARLSKVFTVSGGYAARHRDMDGSALISSMYTDTTNFAGLEPADVQNLLQVDNAFKRDEDTFDVRVDARNLGPFRAWGTYANVTQDVDLSEAAAEIVVPGGQSGSFSRQIDRYSVGAGVTSGGASATVEWFSDSADEAVVRTDYLDRDRLRVRLGYDYKSLFRVLGTVETIRAKNDTVGIAYDADTDHYAVALDVMPSDPLTFRVSWDRYKTDTSALYRVPQFFTVDTSLYSDKTDVLEGGLYYRKGKLSVDGGYSTLSNSGSLPLDLDRAFARLGWDFTKTLGGVLAFDWWDYSEDLFSMADYQAKRYAVLLRWHN